ncbi:hypothetical protein FDECE_15862 [Fusarium decemcellulare]|nr:hypothetical protein FDECE_15862 [Fusarium decemcellulare]
MCASTYLAPTAAFNCRQSSLLLSNSIAPSVKPTRTQNTILHSERSKHPEHIHGQYPPRAPRESPRSTTNNTSRPVWNRVQECSGRASHCHILQTLDARPEQNAPFTLNGQRTQNTLLHCDSACVQRKGPQGQGLPPSAAARGAATATATATAAAAAPPLEHHCRVKGHKGRDCLHKQIEQLRQQQQQQQQQAPRPPAPMPE